MRIKFLTAIIIVLLIINSESCVFAVPSDVKGTDYEDVVEKLEMLEILGDYSDGTFKPDSEITRAEFAQIIVNALGIGKTAKYATGKVIFNDVPDNHWAYGYIKAASDMKIINGYEDGKFRPDDKVTYLQAITIIVKALGYEPKAEAMGGFPVGYIAIAEEKNITKDVDVKNRSSITRGDVALMVFNALTVPMMYQKTWGKFPQYEEDDENKNIVNTKLGIDFINGVITDIPNTNSCLEPNEIKVDREKYEVLIEDINFDTLLGLEVKLWTDGNKILAYDIITEENDVFFDTVVSSTEEDGVMLLIKDAEDLDNDIFYEWAKKAKAYVNFKEVDIYDIPVNAYGYFVLNEEEVTYANLFNFTEIDNGAVYSVDNAYKYIDLSGDENKLDLSWYEDNVIIYNDKMEVIDIDDIKVNSAIFAWEKDDKLYLVVKNSAVRGTLERIQDVRIEVDGIRYGVATPFGVPYSDDRLYSFDLYKKADDLNNLSGKTVTVVSNLQYGVILIHNKK